MAGWIIESGSEPKFDWGKDYIKQVLGPGFALNTKTMQRYECPELAMLVKIKAHEMGIGPDTVISTWETVDDYYVLPDNNPMAEPWWTPLTKPEPLSFFVIAHSTVRVTAVADFICFEGVGYVLRLKPDSKKSYGTFHKLS